MLGAMAPRGVCRPLVPLPFRTVRGQAQSDGFEPVDGGVGDDGTVQVAYVDLVRAGLPVRSCETAGTIVAP